MFASLFPRHNRIDSVLGLNDFKGAVDLMHFACHGCDEKDAPLFSRLMLTDRPLFNFEIPFSSFSPNIVFMNACCTASGKMSAGGYLQTMASSFLQNGTKYVIATLWQVDDYCAIIFMEAFYKSLLVGANPLDALNDARLKLYNDPLSNKPFFWAPYVLYSSFV